MKSHPLFVLIPSLLALSTRPVLSASETVATYGGPAGPAGNYDTYSTGFELFENGLFWWQGYSVGGELANQCEIGFKGFAEPSVFPSRPVQDYTNLIAGVGRDDLYVYFADNHTHRLYRKSVWAAPTDPALELPTPYTPPAGGYDFGALTLWNGRLYWTEANGSSLDVLSINTDGSGAQYVRQASGPKIIKLVGFTYGGPVLSSYTNALFALTADGQLLRLNLDPPADTRVLATGVTDFTIRGESQSLPPFGFALFTTIYAATGQKTGLNGNTPPGGLLTINAATGATTTIYTAPGQNQVTAVTADGANIYWTEQPVTCTPPFACLLGDYSTYRQSRPADHSTAPGTVDLIGLPGGDAGVNLRSDGQWVYFLNGTAIKRLSTEATKVELGVEADGLEVVQAIQNLDSQVPLVANKATYVRGYAHVNYYTSKTWFSTALLHGYRNGLELPGSPIYPVQSVGLWSGGPTLPQMRGDAQHSFLFQLPASWVQSGPDLPAQLSFTMTANPDLAIPETSPQPLTNNTVSLLQPATLQRGLVPCLVTVPLVSKQGAIYYYYSGGLEPFLRRGLALLPAEHFDVHPFLVTDPQGDWNNPFDFGNTNYNQCENAWDNALGTVDGLHLWSDPCQGDDEHFMGMLPPQALAPGSAFSGIATRPGKSVVVTVSAGGGWDLAHELGHNYGRKHIDCGDFTNYPDQADFDNVSYPCSLGNPDTNLVTATYGYNPIDNVVIPPNAASDLMSYSSPQWVSAYDWDSNLGLQPLSNLVPAPTAAAKHASPKSGSGLVALVSGRIDPQLAAAQLNPFYLIAETLAPAVVLADSRAESEEAARQPNPVYMRFLDLGGNVLSQVALATQAADGNSFDRIHFGEYVDVPAGVRVVQLTEGGQVLAERFVSANPPVLALGTPALDATANTLYLSWTASDPDGDPLRFTLQYTADNGTTWRALKTDYPYLEITMGTALLPGGTQCRLRVIASDGANTTAATTDPFPIPLHPPMPLIDGVTEGQRVAFGSEISLLGIALDAQNGSESNQLHWSLSGPTPLASDEDALPLTRLSPGDYAATLTATDAAGLVGSTVRNFAVLPPTVPDGPVPALDGLGNDDGYAQATYVPLPLEDGSVASVRLFHASGQLYVSFANLKFGNGTPRSVGLRVDPTATPPATAGGADFGFFVDENGAPLEAQGNGAQFAALLTPPPGFAAVIYRGLNTWSAELSIPDTQLGGWGHWAALMLEHGPAHWPPGAATNAPVSWAPVFLGTNLPAGANRPPVANAGPTFAVSLTAPQTLSLDGSASFDPDGDPLTFAWTQTAGTTVTLVNANTATPSFTAGPVASATPLTFQLVVNDGSANSAPSQVQVTLLPPLAQPAVTPPSSTALLRSDGILIVQLPGRPNLAYQIQASTNLVDWVNLNTVYADYAGRIAFEEALDRTHYPVRFYRAFNP